MLEPQIQMLADYLDAIQARKAAESVLARTIAQEKALAKAIYDDEETYPAEVLMLVTPDACIQIDIRESHFSEYKWPDTPVKVLAVENVAECLTRHLRQSIAAIPVEECV
jgi:hypothetical protein